ncbi:WXG100 family type VII secretion target [Amycolatopsis xylanica]|uniref:ESAT-6-like protein n=1 Tax=Amycolatopsis xylanica TaxID=589385 RepID=A0A1H3GV94_9PSEU|nr:WXG100 family type VII secretion target [Amycolatopsis xylanica]SDY07243.1 WXG100 family type VII secretion target [Amycolatopsis xylanica]
MADGTITYDYNVIDTCLSMMANKASEIQSQTDDLVADVKRIMGEWHGSTADAYEALSTDLSNDLTQNRENLVNLKNALGQGADDMRDQDARGAGAVGR